MAKQIEVTCPPEVGEILVEALQWFVHRHYPHGADECSIAAREALLDLAGKFEQELLVGGRAHYSIRMRAFLCEAVRSYLAWRETESDCCYVNRYRVVLDVCRGDSDGEGFAAATGDDSGESGPGLT